MKKRVLPFVLALGAVVPLAPIAHGGEPGRGLDRFYEQQAVWQDCNNVFPQASAVDTGGDAADPVPDPPLVPAYTECAKILVPKDYRRPQDGTLDIAVSRRRAKDSSERQGSLLLNPGGPGQDGIYMPGDLRDQVLVKHFDLVGFSPRGSGLSTRLWCDLPTTWTASTRPTDEQIAVIAEEARHDEQRCREAGGDLRKYISTANTARDMDVIRAVIGERKINYLGISYGTYLGAVYGSLFPGRLNRSVLDSAMHPDWLYYEATKQQAVASRQNFDAWAAWVAQRNDTYGLGRTAAEVESSTDALGARLAEEPVPWVGGPGQFPVVDRNVLDQVLGSNTTVRPNWHVTTMMVLEFRKASESGALSDDAAAALGIVLDRQDTVRVNGSYQAITCEVDWPTDLNVYYRTMRFYREHYPYGPGAMAAAPSVCAFRSFTPLEKAVPLRRAGYPTGLVVQADFDLKTQYEGGPAMAHRLRDRLLTVTDQGGHGMYGRNACVTQRVDDYLIKGTLPAPGATCAGAPRPDVPVDGGVGTVPSGSLEAQARALTGHRG
ncbi:alpha/beta fold hydrolase [Saccharothrix sp. Mg75]|uniref:alpha/beta fold hydrolase n=1 Tax=Saccharothrix sp. Mg75 TaxID=3445357 RepID=UPI003EEB46B0